jgi:thiol:disulfide interchange protein DsbC
MRETGRFPSRIVRTLAAAGAIAATLIMCPRSTTAQPGAQPAADPAALIKQTIEQRYPGAHVVKVQPSPIQGVFEVYTGAEILYSDARGNYLMGGPIIDTQTHQNLTEARMNEFGRIDFKTLPFDRAIKIVKGNGSRQFAVFSDPDCPFCRELEKTLLNVHDVTMYVFLYPIASLHPEAPAKAHAIWCAKDRAEAWSQWMHEKKLPADAKCSSDPIDQLQKLGDKLQVNSTPTLYFADGRKVAGAVPLQDIEQHLAVAPDTKTNTPAAH